MKTPIVVVLLLGITPYSTYRNYSTKKLARCMIRTMRAPLDFRVEDGHDVKLDGEWLESLL